MIRRLAAVPIALSLACSPTLAAEKKPHTGNPPAARVEQPRAAQPQAQPARPGRAEARPGQAQVVDKLLKMSPSERENALSSLPPARRQNIEKRLGEIQKLPPAQQNRLLYRAEILNSMPPQKANQIRRSARQFQELPEERKPVLNQEMRRLMTMPDEERRERMNSEEFRNRYSANEQQMMQNLMEIRPQP
ncbi:MAG: DUF3106 domain-containing protein [Acidobacteriota bacterium]|nr:DUF3106 domain-containing protein [Acidobacteriota bacterium]